MPDRKHAATTYEEITRETLPIVEMFQSGVRSTTAPERDLEICVRAALSDDARLTAARFDVNVQGSVVWLSGSASGPAEVALAETVTRQVVGVTDVRNEIAIEAEAPE